MAVSFAPQRPNKDNLNIDILIFYKGKRYKRTTGESVPAIYWNSKQKKCIEARDKYEKGIAINKALKKHKEAAEKACNYFTANLIIPDNATFFSKLDEFLYGVDRSKDDFIAYAKQYIEERKGIRAVSTIKSYGSILKMIEKFNDNKKLKFTDINKDFYNRLQNYLYSGGDREEEYSNNYFGRIVKFIKVVYNDAKRNNIHALPDLSGFKVEDRTTDMIYLTADELQKIYDLELTDQTEILVRAKFLIGAHTGLRMSDFNNLNSVNISGKFIVKTTQKTGRKVVIPINSTVKAIFKTVDISGPISEQKINEHIKSIARKAEITEPVIISKYVGGKRIEEVHEKCDLVRSHTARRSFATNAHKAGVPLVSISKILGHTKISTTEKYLRMSEEENAELLLGHEFFK